MSSFAYARAHSRLFSRAPHAKNIRDTRTSIGYSGVSFLTVYRPGDARGTLNRKNVPRTPKAHNVNARKPFRKRAAVSRNFEWFPENEKRPPLSPYSHP